MIPKIAPLVETPRPRLRLALRWSLAALMFWGSLASAGALGRLVQPDGRDVALGESAADGGLTVLFPGKAIPAASWLTLPPGTPAGTVTVAWAGGRRQYTLPAVPVPDLRYAVHVPAHTLALTIPARLSTDPVFERTAERPVRAALVALSATSVRVDLPSWRVAAGSLPFLTVDHPAETPWTVAFSGQGKTRAFHLPAGYHRWTFAPGAWDLVPTTVEVTGSPRITGVQVHAVGPQADLPADPATLLAWPPDQWRTPSHEWFAWTGTSVLVLVTIDYDTQDEYLKRLAFFVEKTGFRGRLVSDTQLAPLHGWNAHDYSAASLAQFFTQAEAEAFPLNGAERELRERLVAAGILVPQAQGWAPGTGALIGISAQSPPALRRVLFVHEGFHGLYFTSQDFRDGVRRAWDALPSGAQDAFRSFLALSQYDPSDEALMVNEFQAYVLQRTSAEWPEFFRDRVRGTSWLSDYLLGAQTLNGLVGTLYGLKSGVISPVQPF